MLHALLTKVIKYMLWSKKYNRLQHVEKWKNKVAESINTTLKLSTWVNVLSLIPSLQIFTAKIDPN